MADAANFIKQMNAQNNYDPEETKWILFGGSYAGAMSVWFRVRYPGLTHGSISSSGPINPVVNYAGFFLIFQFLLIFEILISYGVINII